MHFDSCRTCTIMHYLSQRRNIVMIDPSPLLPMPLGPYFRSRAFARSVMGLQSSVRTWAGQATSRHRLEELQPHWPRRPSTNSAILQSYLRHPNAHSVSAAQLLHSSPKDGLRPCSANTQSTT